MPDRNLQPRAGSLVIRAALKAAGDRPAPQAAPATKNQYAVRFADQMAAEFAQDLASCMKGISASSKRMAGAVRGTKQLDINFSTVSSGLLLGISFKSVHIREATGAQRYTHNLKRNEEELRIEASGYHKRQPYAVMVGVLFLPFDSCDDGKRDNPSSFGSWVRHLRPYAGRSGPKDDEDRFEHIFIALYETDGSNMMFFDVESAPPKNGRPPAAGNEFKPDDRMNGLLTYSQFLAAVYQAYLRRNSAEFSWADEGEEPLVPGETPDLLEDI